MQTALPQSAKSQQPRTNDRFSIVPRGTISFELACDYELVLIFVVKDPQHIRLAADLAIFHVFLSPSGARIDLRVVPLAAACALKACVHLFADAQPRPAFADHDGIARTLRIIFD